MSIAFPGVICQHRIETLIIFTCFSTLVSQSVLYNINNKKLIFNFGQIKKITGTK